MLLQRWDRAVNLTSAADSNEERLTRHIKISLAIVPHLPTGLQRLIDIGSGQGFPAIPIAVATGIPIDMIESDRRKAAFLTTALSKLKLVGCVWATRIESVPVAPASCITARALAPLSALVKLAKPLLLPDGVCLFLKGEIAQAEIEQALDTVECDVELISLKPLASHLVKVSAIR